MIDIDDARRLRAVLSSSSPDGDAIGIIDAIGALEDLKNAAAAAQGVLAVELREVREREDADRGVPSARRARGVAAEVALARRESLHRGGQHLALARTLREMPHTECAFRAGRISEWRAQLLLRETGCLELADRQEVDQRLAGDPDELAGLGDGELIARARRRPTVSTRPRSWSVVPAPSATAASPCDPHPR